jgi:hypothetical protein
MMHDTSASYNEEETNNKNNIDMDPSSELNTSLGHATNELEEMEVPKCLGGTKI